MIIETLLSTVIATSNPVNHQPISSNVIIAATYRSSGSSFRSSSGSSFRSSSSSSFRSSPSRSYRSTSTPSFRSTPAPTSKVVINSQPREAPSIPAPSNNIVRINKQVTAPVEKSTPVVKSTSVERESAPVITRERYVERYNDSGITGNPWFWMYMFDNNRQQVQQPAQVIVRDSDNKTVTVPETQMIVRKYSWSPIREFFVFALGGGIGILFGRKTAL